MQATTKQARAIARKVLGANYDGRITWTNGYTSKTGARSVNLLVQSGANAARQQIQAAMLAAGYSDFAVRCYEGGERYGGKYLRISGLRIG